MKGPTSCRPMMFHPAIDPIAHKLSALPQVGAMNPLGKRLPKPTMVHNQYQHGIGQGTKPQKHSNLQSHILHQPAQPKVVCPILRTVVPRTTPLPF